MSAPKATVVISVYNNLAFLQLVLAGFELQTEKDFEIIVSDDGSGTAFVEGLQQTIKSSPLNIRHNWHEDEGFRKNKILNNSISIAAATYLIFVDGDCIPHPEFVREHLQNAQKRTCLVGRRVDLSDRITKELTPDKVKAGYLFSSRTILKMFADHLRGRLGHLRSGLYIRNGWLRKLSNQKSRGLLGANFSLHKADILAINGFDERYTNPTFGEDSDVELRLSINGVGFRSLIGIAVMYHCHHKLLPRPQESKQLYEQAVREARAFTPYGIIKAAE